MSRYTLIREIFDNIPRTYKGLNREGEHVVQLSQNTNPVYATLERLPYAQLVKLAKTLNIVEERTAVEEGVA
ncbi:MAG: hypothetical protein K0Q57_767 [Gammaproteobacteria bacterium]|jgi:hypothetical protein|nr:hypothetical protein [Gammaproteobacteria bacterium]